MRKTRTFPHLYGSGVAENKRPVHNKETKKTQCKSQIKNCIIYKLCNYYAILRRCTQALAKNSEDQIDLATKALTKCNENNSKFARRAGMILGFTKEVDEAWKQQ